MFYVGTDGVAIVLKIVGEHIKSRWLSGHLRELFCRGALMISNMVIYSFFLFLLWFSVWVIHMEVIMHRGRCIFQKKKKHHESDLLTRVPVLPTLLLATPAPLPFLPQHIQQAFTVSRSAEAQSLWVRLCSLNLSRWLGLSSADMVHGRHRQLEVCGLDMDPAKYFTRLNWALEKYSSRANQCMKKHLLFLNTIFYTSVPLIHFINHNWSQVIGPQTNYREKWRFCLFLFQWSD